MGKLVELAHADTLQLRVSHPFNFRYTLWKPSHFATELEAHSPTESWRTLRLGELTCGVHAYMTDEQTLTAEVFADSGWSAGLARAMEDRLRWSYGLDEDLTGFVLNCGRVAEMREPIAMLGGMRQSCPENLFEIAIISLLLQNTTVGRTTQMVRNLLMHYGKKVSFAGVELRAFFSPHEIADVPEERFRLDDRLGYRAKYIGRFASFFRENASELEGMASTKLVTKFQEIKGVGPYTAAVIASHASRDPSALGLDVWNRKILSRHLLGLDDSDAATVMRRCTELFPGYEGLAALYLVEFEYAANPIVPLRLGRPDSTPPNTSSPDSRPGSSGVPAHGNGARIESDVHEWTSA